MGLDRWVAVQCWTLRRELAAAAVAECGLAAQYQDVSKELRIRIKNVCTKEQLKCFLYLKFVHGVDQLWVCFKNRFHFRPCKINNMLPQIV